LQRLTSEFKKPILGKVGPLLIVLVSWPRHLPGESRVGKMTIAGNPTIDIIAQGRHGFQSVPPEPARRLHALQVGVTT